MYVHIAILISNQDTYFLNFYQYLSILPSPSFTCGIVNLVIFQVYLDELMSI